MKPTVGRIVHYISLRGPDGSYPDNAHSPAVITRVWTDTCVNLAVFEDASVSGVRFVTSCVQDESSTPALYTWHWPERE